MKRFLIMIMAVLLISAMTLTACGTGGDQSQGDDQTEPADSEIENETDDGSHEIPEVHWKWVFFGDAMAAIKVPDDLEFTEDEDSKGNFIGKSESIVITLTRWDRVSYPDIDDLAALVEERTKKPVTVEDHNDLQAVRVNGLDDIIRLFFMNPEGDDYILSIEPDTGSDPDLTLKDIEPVAEDIAESLYRYEGLPVGIVYTLFPGTEFPVPDYMTLVNYKHPVKESWENKIDLVKGTNSMGNSFRAERTTYKAYLALKHDLEENDGIYTDVDFGLRTLKEQQAIVDEFTEKYGAAYASSYAAKPGSSEHHTGLALDIYLIIDGKNVYLNEEMEKYPEIWAKIHPKLADYGFILRYPKGKNTGYPYEPWHIRYVGPEKAREIMAEPGLTLEKYLSRG